MRKTIRDNKYWEDRIIEAHESGFPFWSVFRCPPGEWEKINAAHQEAIRKHIPPEASVVDLGCGYGRMSELFANYTGVDSSSAMIAKAKSIYDKKFICADVQKLPFKDKEFDWALLVSVKTTAIVNGGAAEWDNIVREAKRVAKNVLNLEYGYEGKEVEWTKFGDETFRVSEVL